MKSKDIPQHHLVYGKCRDFITGEEIIDTDDERYRQKIARFVVEKKGWPKAEITPHMKIETLFGKKFVVSKITLYVTLNGKPFMLIRYAPGSIVTRERSAVAAARVLLPDSTVPIAVVTNGKDAEILYTHTGEVINEGMNGIPSYKEAPALLTRYPPLPFKEDRRERELRILNVNDVEVCCVGDACPLPGSRKG